MPWRRVAEDVRILARTHLHLYGDHTQITDVYRIVEGLGVRLILKPFWHDRGFTGIAAIDETTGYQAILVNSLLSIPRRNFTISHELGHIVMRHRAYGHYALERLANIYAAELLMPMDRIIAQVRLYGPNVCYLAGINRVSVSAMSLRLQELAAILAG